MNEYRDCIEKNPLSTQFLDRQYSKRYGKAKFIDITYWRKKIAGFTVLPVLTKNINNHV